MISREDALNKVYELIDVDLLSEGEDWINAIYDSIGSCSECEYKEVIDSGSGIIGCNRGSFDPVEPDFFCADFEAKDED